MQKLNSGDVYFSFVIIGSFYANDKKRGVILDHITYQFFIQIKNVNNQVKVWSEQKNIWNET